MSLEVATERLSTALTHLENMMQSKAAAYDQGCETGRATSTAHLADMQTIGLLQAENSLLRETVAKTLGLLDSLIERVEGAGH